jgi:hypothetical protein
MATDHTPGAPPSRGSTILVNIGCTANSSAALRKMDAVKTTRSWVIREAWSWVAGVVGRELVMIFHLSAAMRALASRDNRPERSRE